MTEISSTSSSVSPFSPKSCRPTKKPYKELNLAEKVELIRMAEENQNLSQASIAEKYCIAKSNVCRILQRKREYLGAFESAGFSGSRKRKLKPRLLLDDASKSQGTDSLPAPIPTKQSRPTLVGNSQESALSPSSLSPALTNPGNETLRAHMYKQHQISRMFMCRCCNWAFPDKTSLHMHIQAKEDGKSHSVSVIGKGLPPSANPHHAASAFSPLHLLNNNSLTPTPRDGVEMDGVSVPSFFCSPLPGIDENLLARLRDRLLLNQVLSNPVLAGSSWPFSALSAVSAAAATASVSSASGVSESALSDNGNVKKESEDGEIQVSDEPKVSPSAGMRGESEEVDEEHGEKKRNSSDNEMASFVTRQRSTENNGESPSEGAFSPPVASSGELASVAASSASSPEAASALLYGLPPSDSSTSAIAAVGLNAFQNLLKLDASGTAFPFAMLHQHVSPSETHSTASPQASAPSPAGTQAASPEAATIPPSACFDCNILQAKAIAADTKANFLEAQYNALQGELAAISGALRAANATAAALRSALRDCQEEALRFASSQNAADPHAVLLFLNHILKTTLIR